MYFDIGCFYERSIMGVGQMIRVAQMNCRNRILFAIISTKRVPGHALNQQISSIIITSFQFVLFGFSTKKFAPCIDYFGKLYYNHSDDSHITKEGCYETAYQISTVPER